MRILIVILLLLSSCQYQSKVVERIEQHTISEPIEFDDDFLQYWSDLGDALLTNDTIELDKYLDSTVFFYGREDGDPRFALNGLERIFKVREIYLSSGIYDFQIDSLISYPDFFSDIRALEGRYIKGEDYQDIEDFVFRKNSSKEWKLTRLYCNTR